MRRPKRYFVIVSSIMCCILLFTMCINDQEQKPDYTVKPYDEQTSENSEAKRVHYNDFVGADMCKKCHAEAFNSHAQTSHFLTSSNANEKNIKGSFKNGKNTFTYNNDLYVAMEKRDSGLCQVVYYKGEEKIALKFGLAIGSGTKGQSYARWEENKLFQLPLTYYTIAGKWANSPGFPNKVQYERPITARCIECHATYADVFSSAGSAAEQFNEKTIITGITCEKCHGPGAQHVKFYTENPGEKGGKYIVNPGKLSRQQQLDLCALCHGGRLENKQPAFSYVAGDTLSHFFNTDGLNKTGRNYVSVDVHGNQFGLMSASKCFLKSNMTCNSCHSAHANERGKTQLFSSRCQTCHTGEHKVVPGMNAVPASIIRSNCIDCHMALEPSHMIVLFTSGMESPKAASFRSHFISVYPKETQKFIDSLKKR
jgi:hypothetical protein